MKQVIKQFGGAIIAMIVVLIVLGIIFGISYFSNSDTGLFSAFSSVFNNNEAKELKESTNVEIKSVSEKTSNIRVEFNMSAEMNTEYSLKDLVSISSDDNYNVYLIEATKDNEDVIDSIFDSSTQKVKFIEPGNYSLRIKVVLDSGYSKYAYYPICIN